MSNALYPYRYDAQIEKYIQQFMRALSGFQVQDGVDRDNDGSFHTERVPVVYGNMSRIVASILNKRETFPNTKLPMIAANMTGFEQRPEGKKSHFHVDSLSNAQLNLPDGTSSVHRIIGPPYNLTMEVNIYASSTSELFAIVEQILLVFNPRLTIRLSTDGYDPNYITEIILNSIQPEIQYPMGTESRTVMMGMDFTVPVRLSYPKGLSDGIINEIHSRILNDDGSVVYEENINDETT